MVRKIFKGRVISTAGPLPGQLTVDNLKRWISLRKGTFSEDVDESTTHLLCTEEQFRKRVPQVKQALSYGKALHIVHYDWFEFSASSEKRQPEREYSMRNVVARERSAQLEEARITRGKRDAEKFGVNTCRDRDFFPYEINITRDDQKFGEAGQRFTLYLWESNAKPHLYWFTAKFLKRKGDSQPSYYRPSPCSGKWRREMDLLTDFFHKKTGIEWEDRVLKQGTAPPSVFQYAPPTGGKPVGRRLRYSYEVCLEMNAQLRHLPWPPVDIAKQEGPADAPADGVKDDTCEETSAQYDEEVQLGDCAYVTDPQSSDESGDACHESCRPVSHITDDTSVVDDIDMPEKGHTDSSLPKSGHGNS